MVKAILTLIIGSFALFFGYQELSDGNLDGENYAAIVGRSPIPFRKFDQAFESTAKRLREDLKDKIPENFESTIKSMILNQFIQQELAAQFAQSLKLQISPERLSREIVRHPALSGPNGFNYDYYHRVFRPSYRGRTGEDFEKSLERELLAEDLRRLVQNGLEPWQKILPDSKGTEELLGAWLEHFQKGIRTEILVR